MQDLETLRKLQTLYQEKFAELLLLQEKSDLSGEQLSTPEYLAAKISWQKAGAALREYLEKTKL